MQDFENDIEKSRKIEWRKEDEWKEKLASAWAKQSAAEKEV